jgi:hypothetical protein
MIRLAIIAVASLGVAGVSCSTAKATWSMNLDILKTGTSYDTTPPYSIKLSFSTVGAGGSVLVRVENNTKVADGCHIMDVVFNIQHFWFTGGRTLSIAFDSGTQSGTGQIDENKQQMMVPSEANFDAKLSFFNGFSGGFNAGEYAVFKVTSSDATFDEDAFRDVNTPDQNPDFAAGVHYGLNSNGQSGTSVANLPGPGGGVSGDPVPVPSSILVLLMAGAGLIAFRNGMSIV